MLKSNHSPETQLADTPIEVGIMLKRHLAGLGLTLVLFSLLVVVRVAAQGSQGGLPQGGFPPGAASTDSGLGGGNAISGSLVASTGQRISKRVSIRLRTST